MSRLQTSLLSSLPLGSMCLALAACSGLTPPTGSPQLSVTMKAQPGSSVLPAVAFYVSRHCASNQRVAMGLEPELKILRTELQRQGNSDTYQTRLYLDGGGRCQWQLQTVMLRAKYSLEVDGRMVTGNLEESFIVEKRPAKSGQISKEKSDPSFVIRQTFNPFITTDDFNKETLGFRRDDGWPRFSYETFGAEAIQFEPWVSQPQSSNP